MCEDFIVKLIALLKILFPIVLMNEMEPFSLCHNILEPTAMSALLLSNGSSRESKSETV